MRSVASAHSQSSLSANWRYLPAAAAMARLRLSATPEFRSFSIRRKRLSFSHQARQRAALPSVLPSSTSSTSISRHVWARMLARQRSRVFSAL